MKIRIEPISNHVKKHYVEGIEYINYWIEGSFIVIETNVYHDECNFILSYFALDSSFIEVNGILHQNTSNFSLDVFSQLISHNKKIKLDKENIIYAQNSVAYVITRDKHDDFYLNLALKKLN